VDDSRSEPSSLTEIDHVAVAVRDLDAAIAWYESALGARVAHRERVDPDGVEEALLQVAESFIQLLSPTTDSSPVARFLDRKGEGIHHVGYRVADCAAAMEKMRAAGAVLIDERPRPGSRGTTVAFVHPRSAFGTLIELVQTSPTTRLVPGAQASRNCR
jgi:methylmalonyl-CoA epimerase